MTHKLVVLEWLFKADQDYNFAKISLEGKEGFYDLICFHFHQSAEKYLKAYVVKHNLKFEKQHDLIKLLKTCSDHDKEFQKLKKDCQYLNPFYFETRYPDIKLVSINKKQTTKAKKSVENIQNFIRQKTDINHEVREVDLKTESKRIDQLLKKFS